MTQPLIKGTFHFHSTYSHDGRSTLPEIASTLKQKGFAFCIMTDHFEDFDAAKFDRYVTELKEVSETSGFLFIPGIEVHLAKLDTLIFPVPSFDELTDLAETGKDTQPPMFKVMAHPSKYPFDMVARHLERFQIQGVELWNQQADGSHIPPVKFLELLKTQTRRNDFRHFFGCDLHKVNLTVTNFLELPAPEKLTAESVAAAVISGAFVTRNIPTGIEYHNGSVQTQFDPWLASVQKRSFFTAKVRQYVRRSMKSFYKKLPRSTQHSLNDFKNFVRNKV